MKFALTSRFLFSSAINHREHRPPTVTLLSCLRFFDHIARGSRGDLGLCPDLQGTLPADNMESVPGAVATGSPCKMPEIAGRLVNKEISTNSHETKHEERSSICPSSCDFVDRSTPADRGRNSFFSRPAKVTRSLPLPVLTSSSKAVSGLFTVGYRFGELGHHPANASHRRAEPSHRRAEASHRGSEVSHCRAETSPRGAEPSHRCAEASHYHREPSQRGAEAGHRGWEAGQHVAEAGHCGAAPSHRGAEAFRLLHFRAVGAPN